MCGISEAKKKLYHEKFSFSNNPIKQSDDIIDINVEVSNARNIIKDKISSIINRYNKNYHIRNKIREDIDETIKLFGGDNEFNKNNDIPTLICDILNETENSITFCMYRGSKLIRIALSKTIKNIEKELKYDPSISSLSGVNNIYSDNDTCCIYVEFKK